MSTHSEEQVLAIPTKLLRQAGLFHGLSLRVDYYAKKLLDPADAVFLPRSQAEHDPEFKQLVPYAVLCWQDRIFHYSRGKGAGEKRLHAQRSLGIGGHVNPCDADEPGTHPYRRALWRELAEEVDLLAPHRERCLGFINDDLVPVGQVHLGIVHLFDLDRPDVKPREANLCDAGFSPIADLLKRRAEFETWSQFILEHFNTV